MPGEDQAPAQAQGQAQAHTERMLERIMMMMDQNNTATHLQLEALTLKATQDAQRFQRSMAEAAAQIAAFRAEIDELKKGSITPAHASSSHNPFSSAIPGEQERHSPVSP